MDDQTAFIYATAIRRAALNTELESPVGSLMTVSASGQVALQRAIEDMGLAFGDKAEDMAKSILYKNSDRGTIKSSRRRIDLDATTPIEGTDKTLLDLLDNDVYAITDRTVRSQSNHASLSSIGIQNRDKNAWKQAAIDEANSTEGMDAKAAAKVVDNMFSYFGDGAFAGGSGAAAGRINKLGILSYLPQLGITQIAEAGVSMSVTGIKSWAKYAGKTIPEMLKGKDPEILDSLGGSHSYTGDHKLFVRTDHLDDVDLDSRNTQLRIVDHLMDQGMRGMGHLSGFYKINEMLQSIAALSMNDYMVKNIVKGVDNTRMKSMGVDDEFRSIIKNKHDEGIIEYDADGYVKDMHVEQWKPEELELLQVVTKRNVDQTIQKSRRGEAQYWQYETLGSLFSSLKSFTFTAMQKQLIKNARMADPESFTMIIGSIGTAALAYAARQAVNGNLDTLTTCLLYTSPSPRD